MNLAALYQHACDIELQAFKPGNVSIYANGHDMTVEDFRLSAKVSSTALCHADYSLGEKIYYAVKATREAVGCNTNLGIILLCAPLIQAVQHYPNLLLRNGLKKILQQTTIEDADWVFKAIVLAAPGGLGTAKEQDVHEAPSMTLQQVMQLSATKDRIALQYVTDYKDIFDFAVLRYNSTLLKWGIHAWAAVTVYTELLSRYPDSHIERKYGSQYSGMVAHRMMQLNQALSDTEHPESLMPLLHDIDLEFKAKGINPGTTADLVVTTALTALLNDFVGHAPCPI